MERAVVCQIKPGETCIHHMTCQEADEARENKMAREDCGHEWHLYKTVVRPSECPQCGEMKAEPDPVRCLIKGSKEGAMCRHNVCKRGHAEGKTVAQLAAPKVIDLESSPFADAIPVEPVDEQEVRAREGAAQARVEALERTRVNGGDKLVVECACGESLLSSGVIMANLNQLLASALKHRTQCRLAT